MATLLLSLLFALCLKVWQTYQRQKQTTAVSVCELNFSGIEKYWYLPADWRNVSQKQTPKEKQRASPLRCCVVHVAFVLNVFFVFQYASDISARTHPWDIGEYFYLTEIYEWKKNELSWIKWFFLFENVE